MRANRSSPPSRRAAVAAVVADESDTKKPKPRNTRLQVPPDVATLGNIRKALAPAFLGMAESTFERISRQPGFPPSFRIGPRMVVWRIADLIAWRDAQPSTAPRSASPGQRS